ncbi:MAG: hypothetical protein AAFR93_12510 [Pseudomonadota bacterium]
MTQIVRVIYACPTHHRALSCGMALLHAGLVHGMTTNLCREEEPWRSWPGFHDDTPLVLSTHRGLLSRLEQSLPTICPDDPPRRVGALVLGRQTGAWAGAQVRSNPPGRRS